MKSSRSSFEGQLSFFEEPAPDRTAALAIGDRWIATKSTHQPGDRASIWLPPLVEVVIRRFDQFTVTFARPDAGPLSQWCLSLDSFFTMLKRIS